MFEFCRALISARQLSRFVPNAATASALTIALITLLFAAPLAAQPMDDFFRSAVMPADETAEAAILELQQKQAMDTTVVRSRLVEVDLAQLQQPTKAESAAQQEVRLQLSFFPDVEAPLVLDDIKRDDYGFTIYHGLTLGATKDANPGTVVLVERDGALAGTFEVGDRFLSLRHASGSIHLLEEIDRSRFASGAEPLLPGLHLLAKAEIVGGQNGEMLTGDVPSSGKAEGAQPEINILVAYTKAAREAAGSVNAIQHQVVLAIGQLNAALTHSEINAKARLAGLGELDYTETGASETDLQWLRETSKKTPFKNSWRADVVSLLVEQMNDACGIGYLMTSNSSSFAPRAVNVVRRQCATGNYSFAHEVGHNLGAAHDRAHSSTPGAFSYSYGYQAPTRDFRSVMAYNCSGVDCPRILNFSNPDVDFNLQPTGISASSPISADNALTIHQTSPTVAASAIVCRRLLSANTTSTAASASPTSIPATTTGRPSWSTSPTTTAPTTADSSAITTRRSFPARRPPRGSSWTHGSISPCHPKHFTALFRQIGNLGAGVFPTNGRVPR